MTSGIVYFFDLLYFIHHFSFIKFSFFLRLAKTAAWYFHKIDSATHSENFARFSLYTSSTQIFFSSYHRNHFFTIFEIKINFVKVSRRLLKKPFCSFLVEGKKAINKNSLERRRQHQIFLGSIFQNFWRL
jgi:hypothetical protein